MIRKMVTSMRNLVLHLLLASLALFGANSCAEEAAETVKSDTFFTVSGDATVAVDDAKAEMIKIRGKIPAMIISSTPASIKKLGTSYSVNLFFSNDFEPKPGTYPIEFSYRKASKTLGGSFMQRGNMFSHDTQGTAEFVKFGEQVKVRFEFQTFDASDGTAGRQSVTVKGKAVCACPHSEIFN
jgi:hypothetical protein